MIIRSESGRAVITLQTDHAALSGWMARHWGGPNVQAPSPLESAVLAAIHHDDGWYPWEAAPRLNPATGLPYNFTEMPLADHLALYRAGIRLVRALDPYAGLLTSMHIVRLYRPRLQDGSTDTAQVAEYIAEQEQLQDQLKNALCPPDSPNRAEWEARLQVNHRLLAFWDRLSLVFCMHSLAELGQGMRLDRMPLDYAGTEDQVQLRLTGASEVRLTPYPFRRNPLRCALPVLEMSPGPYNSDAAIQRALTRARRRQLVFTLVAG